ncbi:type II secretion system protein [Aliivibrio sp. S4TY2]|uniref:type IV pilus modification PilV family protein n=1 Tax=unclassified Aliivibrio TaxID=2645654 RepID=UPI002378841C|nr:MULTISPECIES: type II secretion system protein [unclassified Aliivibrio]MDD9155277.1 type II secretion system protein [Aliivibrio sp. S4TY2]MDD9159171.1 type II secretion system protein [Aliivibrio sp. S4TY1]MDD9163279.1 type II secretion system protein [Aliivibrio sp. S4MY2]MDD9167170.1 type II secretion system protein [Aliivibrio sp. S4MY4]MDD9184356.1 type II secretion system protein [Aliivibrio sp. S4MY3]
MLAKHQKGFSLVSIVLSIVLMSFALIIITTSLVPRSQHNAELMYSTKAAELGAAVMDEIVGRQFDQNSGPNGGLPVCEPTTSCTPPGDRLGEDGDKEKGNRTLYNDVDDFNRLTGSVKDVLGNDLAGIYPNFSISIEVFYDANLDGKPDAISGNLKRIVVDVIDPSGQHYAFSVIRGNF